MRTKEGGKIFSIIRSHVGLDQAISAPEICRELRWRPSHERTVRRIIADEAVLWPGVLVCAAPARGYFCAETYEEAQTYRNWIADLANKSALKLKLIDRASARLGFNFRHAA